MTVPEVKAAEAAEVIRLLMLESGESRFTYTDLGGLGPEDWHKPYLLIRAGFFDSLDELKAKL